MPQRTHTPLRWLGPVMRALLLFTVLATLMVGPPAALLLFGHQPTSLPGIDSLTQPDDGTLFFTALTCIGWLAWAGFAASVLVEVSALLRRQAAPRLRGLGAMQSLASFLVGGIVLLAPAAATATAAPSVVVTQRIDAPRAHTTPQVPASQAHHPAGMTHTVVSPTESPWALAETYLGSGLRWKDIAALNPDIPELASGDAYLPRGAVITLPADAMRTASNSPQPSVSDTTSAGEEQTQLVQSADQPEIREHRVMPGDTLWGIAQDELGDGAQYPALFKATQGKPQPHGLPHVRDADLIYPGQEIIVPSASELKPPAADPHHEDPKHSPTNTPPQEATQQPDHTSSDQKPSQDTPRPDQAPTSQPSTPTGGTTTPSHPRSTQPQRATEATPPAATPTPSRSTPEPAAIADDTTQTVGFVGLAASGIFAAAVLIALGNRRLLQRRALRRGQQIPLPTGRAAITEMKLRSLDASVELQLLDDMLRTAAQHLAAADNVLPELLAIRLGEAGALLYLAEPMAPVPPFTTDDGEASTTWWCSATTDSLGDTTQLREIPPPYPGLLALGSGQDASIVLVDLEQIGALHITGDRREEVWRMAAITLALSPLGGQMELAVAGTSALPDLDTLDPQRVTLHRNLEAALTVFTTHRDEQQPVLAHFGNDGLAAARLEEDAEEVWPLILLADLDHRSDSDSINHAWALLNDIPYTAIATLTSSGRRLDMPEDVWVVDTNSESVIVPGTNVHCTLPGCSPDEYADVLELVATAEMPTQPDSSTAETPAATSHSPSHVPNAETDAATLLTTTTTGNAAHPPINSLPQSSDLHESLLDITELAGLDLDDPQSEEAGADPDAPPLNAPDALPHEAAFNTDDQGDDLLDSQLTSDSISLVAPAEQPLPRLTIRLPQHVEASSSPLYGQLDEDADQPFIRILGPVSLEGARGSILSNRKTAALELAAWLALHPGVSASEIDDVLAPWGRISRDTRNSRIRDLRKWLGQSREGNPHLPNVATQPDKRFRLSEVQCDWLILQRLVTDHSGDAEAREHRLRTALALIAGRPFTGVPTRRYAWAEELTQQIIKTIVHAADEHAEQQLQSGNGHGALWAANQGLSVAQEVEQLWRHRFRAHALLGQDDELEQAIQTLEALLLELGCSMDEETSETVHMLHRARR